MNFLIIEKFRHSLSDINGKVVNPTVPSYYTELKNWTPAANLSISHIPIPGEQSDAVVGITGLSRSKPDNPSINLPLAIAELRDLPRMLRTMGIDLGNSGKNARKKRRRGLVKPDTNLGSQYLNQKFGWDPLFRDLKQLLNFEENVSRKTKELQNMYNNGGIRRRVQLPGGRQHEEYLITAFSGAATLVKRHVFKETVLERWMTTRWIPTAIPKDRSNPALRKLAVEIAYGGRQNAADAWNAVPWSWLADWAGTTGDYLNVHSNRVPLVYASCAIMRKRVTTEHWSYPQPPQDAFSGGIGTRTLELKLRNAYIPDALPTAYIPFLGAGQLAILGSLGISRR